MSQVWPLVVLILCALAACAKGKSPDPYMSDYQGGYAEESERSSDGAFLRDAPPPSAPSAAPAPKRSTAAGSGARPGDAPAVASTPSAEPPANRARMVHYSGYAKLRVEKVEEASDRLVALARSMGGFVEKIAGSVVTMRVPVARFDEAVRATLALGEVLEKSVTAQDVTESFQAVELRLMSARGTLKRLQALLAKSEDEQEKLALVREIQRVSEQIDLLEAQARTLSSLADFSRITVQLQGREVMTYRANGGQVESQPFVWIRALSPFANDHLANGKRLEVPVPDGFVELDLKGRFVAESADGARFWSGRFDHGDLVADGPFWADAIQSRLAGDFAKAERGVVGRFQSLRLVDRSDKPYIWYVLVDGDGPRLDVIEILYPNTEAEARYHAKVQDAIVQMTGGDT